VHASLQLLFAILDVRENQVRTTFAVLHDICENGGLHEFVSLLSRYPPPIPARAIDGLRVLVIAPNSADGNAATRELFVGDVLKEITGLMQKRDIQNGEFRP
jgi:hypothetical protein